MLIFLFYLALLATFSSKVGQAEVFHGNDAARLMKYLAKSSNASLLPVINNGSKPKAVVVKIGVMLYQIISVKWHDELLNWEPKDYGGLKSINIEKEKLWVPDIYIYNHAEGGVKSALDQWKTPITLSSTGKCSWMSPAVVKTSCKLNIRYFPFDEQYCKIKFGSWTYHGFQLDLHYDHKTPYGDTSKFVKSGEWDLSEFRVQRNQEMYACCAEPYLDVTYTLIIRRRTRYYYINMLLPNMFITALTLVAFCLPPDCGERISLIITNFLAMVVFLLLIAEILPPNSEVTPMISIYCAGLMCEVGMALVASCVVLRLYCRHSGFDQMPSWVKVGVLQWLAKITFTSKLVAKIDKDAEEKAGKVKDLEGGERCVSNGALVDHVSLLSSEWDSTYDIDTTEKCPEDEGKTGQPWSGHKAMNNNATGTPQTDQVNKVAASRMHTAVLDTKDCICELLVDKLESRQKTLLEHVTNMTSLLTDQEIDEEKRKEWQLASSILDRSFLVFFIVALIVSSVAIFMQVPNK